MEENVDRLCQLAGELGLIGVPVFLFHEGRDRDRRRRPSADREPVARRLSAASICRAPTASRNCSRAVAVYAAGGYRALTAYGEKKGGEMLRLTAQLRE